MVIVYNFIMMIVYNYNDNALGVYLLYLQLIHLPLFCECNEPLFADAIVSSISNYDVYWLFFSQSWLLFINHCLKCVHMSVFYTAVCKGRTVGMGNDLRWKICMYVPAMYVADTDDDRDDDYHQGF